MKRKGPELLPPLSSSLQKVTGGKAGKALKSPRLRRHPCYSRPLHLSSRYMHCLACGASQNSLGPAVVNDRGHCGPSFPEELLRRGAVKTPVSAGSANCLMRMTTTFARSARKPGDLWVLPKTARCRTRRYNLGVRLSVCLHPPRVDGRSGAKEHVCLPVCLGQRRVVVRVRVGEGRLRGVEKREALHAAGDEDADPSARLPFSFAAAEHEVWPALDEGVDYL